MSSDRVIIDATKMAQRLLSQNLAPTHNLPDATTVMRFRDLVRSPAIQSALERSSDTFVAFTLRAVERKPQRKTAGKLEEASYRAYERAYERVLESLKNARRQDHP
jgi:hypothetical protein